jgi:pyrroloquinoline quinone biosynthesis protein B
MGPYFVRGIEGCPALHPGPGPRQTPVAGVVLTDAALDHTLGVARLHEADAVELVAPVPVREALLSGPRLGAVLGPYTVLLWRELGTIPLPLDPELAATAMPVAAKRLRYAAGTGDDDPRWVAALVLREPATGKSLKLTHPLWEAEFGAGRNGGQPDGVDRVLRVTLN